jgi:hypothetical protein
MEAIPMKFDLVATRTPDRLVLFALLLSSLTVIALAIAVVTAPASAQMPGANNAAVQAAISSCKEDRAMFCPKVSPGGGRIARCLMEHVDALTPGCRTALNDARATMNAGGSVPR